MTTRLFVVAGRTVDFITDFYVIVLSPLVMAGLIIAIGIARVARHPAKRNTIGYFHGSALLLLSFLVLPATSMKIFRLLAPCFKLRTNNTWLHYADLAVNCESRRFLDAHTLGVIMIFMYPVGIPLCYACVLWHFRDLINPPGCSDELHAMRVRNEAKISRPELQAIDFLFSCYRPSAWWFEVFDSLRRIAATGLIRYVAKTSGPPIAGILISLVSLIVFREVQPYEVSIALLTCSVFFAITLMFWLFRAAVRERLDQRPVDLCNLATCVNVFAGLRAAG